MLWQRLKKLVPILIILLIAISACTIRSNQSQTQETFSNRFRLTYISADDIVGEDDINAEVVIERDKGLNTTLHVERWNSKSKQFVTVGALRPGEIQLYDWEKILGGRFSSRYKLTEVDAAGAVIFTTEQDIFIPIHHIVSGAPGYAFDTEEEKSVGYFVVLDSSPLEAFGRWHRDEPLQKKYPSARSIFLRADFGVFPYACSIDSSIPTPPREFEPLPLVFSMERAKGLLYLRPELYQDRNSSTRRQAYQDVLISVERNLGFRLKIDQYREASAADRKKAFRAYTGGLVRYDSGNETQVVCQDELTDVSKLLGVFSYKYNGADGYLWFSATSGRGFFLTLDNQDQFTVIASPGIITNLDCETGLSLHDQKLSPIRNGSATLTRISELQKTILEADRLYARKGIRVDLTGEGCKNTTYTQQQLALGQDLLRAPGMTTSILKHLKVRRILFDCLPYEGLYVERDTLFISGSTPETLSVLLSRMEKGLWQPTPLPIEYFIPRVPERFRN